MLSEYPLLAPDLLKPAAAYVPVVPVEPVSVTPESVDAVVPLESGPIKFGPNTTYDELMSGRVIVATLRERDPHEYKNNHSVKRLDHDKLFYAFDGGGQWKLIPGQARHRPSSREFTHGSKATKLMPQQRQRGRSQHRLHHRLSHSRSSNRRPARSASQASRDWSRK
jgi:hypothetical protein